MQGSVFAVKSILGLSWLLCLVLFCCLLNLALIRLSRRLTSQIRSCKGIPEDHKQVVWLPALTQSIDLLAENLTLCKLIVDIQQQNPLGSLMKTVRVKCVQKLPGCGV